MLYVFLCAYNYNLLEYTRTMHTTRFERFIRFITNLVAYDWLREQTLERNTEKDRETDRKKNGAKTNIKRFAASENIWNSFQIRCWVFFLYLFLISTKREWSQFVLNSVYPSQFNRVCLSFALVSTTSSSLFFPICCCCCCDNLPWTCSCVLCPHFRILASPSVRQTDEEEASWANELYVYYFGIYTYVGIRMPVDC